MQLKVDSAVLLVSLPMFGLCAAELHADDEVGTAEELAEITVNARRVANTRPAGTYASPATVLRFDPSTQLQSRGLAEGQSDVTVRGGVFENTGFKLGAVTVMDPQTGHYVAELPVDPTLMSMPTIYTGIDSAVNGFNSAVATVSYGIAPVRDGGAIDLGLGEYGLNSQAARFGHVADSGVGLALSAARSQGDGTLPNGDHEFAPGLETLTPDGPPPLKPEADGKYPVPMPGKKGKREY